MSAQPLRLSHALHPSHRPTVPIAGPFVATLVCGVPEARLQLKGRPLNGKIIRRLAFDLLVHFCVHIDEQRAGLVHAFCSTRLCPASTFSLPRDFLVPGTSGLDTRETYSIRDPARAGGAGKTHSGLRPGPVRRQTRGSGDQEQAGSFE